MNYEELPQGTILQLQDGSFFLITGIGSLMPEVKGAWGSPVYFLENCTAEGEYVGTIARPLLRIMTQGSATVIG